MQKVCILGQVDFWNLYLYLNVITICIKHIFLNFQLVLPVIMSTNKVECTSCTDGAKDYDPHPTCKLYGVAKLLHGIQLDMLFAPICWRITKRNQKSYPEHSSWSIDRGSGRRLYKKSDRRLSYHVLYLEHCQVYFLQIIWPTSGSSYDLKIGFMTKTGDVDYSAFYGLSYFESKLR